MPQIFRPRANFIARALLWGELFIVAGLLAAAAIMIRSPYVTGVELAPEQPVPFSHKHHAGGLGIDCRYCHTSVETSAFAGIPPTETCMTCHSQLWTEAQLLAPVRASLLQDRPLVWTRVNDLPDFVYFNHSIHISKGVSCVQCHGRVDQMALTRQSQPLFMQFCLDCHRNPAPRLRPREYVFDLAWQPPPGQQPAGEQLMQYYHIETAHLSDCSICHR
jgi:hypothetical protein